MTTILKIAIRSNTAGNALPVPRFRTFESALRSTNRSTGAKHERISQKRPVFRLKLPEKRLLLRPLWKRRHPGPLAARSVAPNWIFIGIKKNQREWAWGLSSIKSPRPKQKESKLIINKQNEVVAAYAQRLKLPSTFQRPVI